MCAAPKGNKFALGLDNSGRPKKYENPQDLFDRIVDYFEYIKGESHIEKREVEIDGVKMMNDVEIWDRPPEPLTITGLSLYLGFANKCSLYDYAKKEEFSDYIKRALSFVEQKYEEMLMSKASTGAIFALKNMGWKDKQEVEAINTNLNTDLNDQERAEALARVKNGLKEFDDYE